MRDDMQTNNRSGRGLAALLMPGPEMTIAAACRQTEEILETTVAHETARRTRELVARLEVAQGEIQTLQDRLREVECTLARRDAEVAATAEQLRAERATNRQRLAAIATIAEEGIAAGSDGPEAASPTHSAPPALPMHGPEVPTPPRAGTPPFEQAAARQTEKDMTTAARRPGRAARASASPSRPRRNVAAKAESADAGDARVRSMTVALPPDVADACASLVEAGVFPDFDAVVVAALRKLLTEAPCCISSEAGDPEGQEPRTASLAYRAQSGVPGSCEPHRIGPSPVRRTSPREVPVDCPLAFM